MFSHLKIGYVPYLTDLSHPDDRRRFPYFASCHRVNFEIANEHNHYDVVLLPAPSNLSKWLSYKKRHPQTLFIFEMVDSLVYQNDWFNMLFKGIGRFIVKKEDRPCLSHKKLLIEWLRVADIVICSNPVVKDEISKWNNNVVFSLDYLEHEYPLAKNDYSKHGKMKLFWEGQGVVLPQLLSYKSVFERVNSFCELHVVTAFSYPRFGQFMNRSTESLLEELPIDTYFHQWDLRKNAALFSEFDCGIIPMNKKDIYGWHKPANKLISFWLSGFPAITSATPAYTDVASKTENDFICSTEDQWVKKIREVYDMTWEDRRKMAYAKYNFAKEFYSNGIHHQFWLNLFNQVDGLIHQKPESPYTLRIAG